MRTTVATPKLVIKRFSCIALLANLFHKILPIYFVLESTVLATGGPTGPLDIDIKETSLDAGFLEAPG